MFLKVNSIVEASINLNCIFLVLIFKVLSETCLKILVLSLINLQEALLSIVTLSLLSPLVVDFVTFIVCIPVPPIPIPYLFKSPCVNVAFF